VNNCDAELFKGVKILN